jgi:hypothetical protein
MAPGRKATDEEILHASRGLLAVKRGDGTLAIRWRWGGYRLRVFLVYLAGSAGMVYVLRDALFSAEHLPVFLCDWGFIAGGLYGLYGALCSLINSTRVTVDRQAVRVSHGPLPWPGGKRVPVADLEQLYVKSEIYVGPRTGAQDWTFQLRAKLKSGQDELIVGGPLRDDRARALEHVLEKQLGIVDRPVP